MIKREPHEARTDQTASEIGQPRAVSLAGAGDGPRLSLVPGTGTIRDRLSRLRPGRPYRLSPPEDRDDTVRQVRVYFGHEDFWEPL